VRPPGWEPRPADYGTNNNAYGGHRGGPSEPFDAATEERLDQWVQAKRDKNFELADSIRADLRADGIEPDNVRPPGWNGNDGRRGYDEETEKELDRWVTAKRDKNWELADAIREDLRARGIEPDNARPVGYQDNYNKGSSSNYGGAPFAQPGPVMKGPSQSQQTPTWGYGNSGFNPGRDFSAPPRRSAPIDHAMEEKLDMWVAAKRDKDFATADRLRAEMRADGVDPDIVRPSARDAHNYKQRDLERMLDTWVEAKRSKDFNTADNIRRVLRSRGLDPDVLRPRNRDSDMDGPSSKRRRY